MSRRIYAISVDFGTESSRTLLLDISNSQEIAALSSYINGVIDEVLPGGDLWIESGWFL